MSMKIIGKDAANFAKQNLKNNRVSYVRTEENRNVFQLLTQYFGANSLEFLESSKYTASFVIKSLKNNTNWKITTFSFFHNLLQESVNICVIYKRKTDLKKIIKTVVFGLDCIYYVKKSTSYTCDHISIKTNNLWLSCICLNQQRTFPKNKGDSIKPDHINAGVSFYSNNAKRILVYRTQHMHKVILHELIHSYDLDSSHTSHFTTLSMENNIKQRLEYNLESEKLLNTNETFTEILACYWNVFLYNYYNPSISISKLIEKEYTLYLQVCFSIFDHFMCDMKCSYKFSDCEKPPIEDTHMFSYLIGKTALWRKMNQLPVTLHCNQHLMKFNDVYNHQFNLTNFSKFIKKVYKNETTTPLLMTSLEI